MNTYKTWLLSSLLGLLTTSPAWTQPNVGAWSADGRSPLGRVGTESFAFTRVGALATPQATADVVEYFNASLDHYFITWVAGEIAMLDAGATIKGWVRTGSTFKMYQVAQAGSTPVCRYYIPPGKGDSHFFGRGTVECDATGQKNPSFVLEDPQFMQTFLPTLGNCPASTTPVYRVFSNRADANHRYMINRALREQMVTSGWLAEGDGPDLVVMCAPEQVSFACQEDSADTQSNAPRVCHDLDGDGIIDTSVMFSNGQLIVRGARTRDIALGAPAGATLKTVTAIGNHAGGPLQELAVRVDDWTSAAGNMARLYILDLDDAVKPQIAFLGQPFGTPTPAYVGFPRAADGRRIPVMVGGQEQSNVAWDYLCRFQPGFNDTGCGQGFAKWSVVPPGASSYRRHQGAWIQDTDGDGTEDLHLPFYSVSTSNRMDGGVLTISMAANQQTWTRLNMAEMAWDGDGMHGESHPPSWASLSSNAQGFDSGRLYGAVSAFSANGRDKALMIGGNPVGYFPATNTSSEAWLIFCQVARYVGLLGNPQGQIGARTLEWGWYLGFNQNVFENNSGDGALLKEGYMAHGCIHRYGDARVESSQGTPSVVFNVFRSADFKGIARCEVEQRALFNGGFTDSLQETYRACVIGNASKPGRWIVQFLDETSGNGRAGLMDAYMWGYSKQLLPGGKFVYLIETLGAPVPFNRAGVPATALKAWTLESSSPSWKVQQVAILPVVGLPALRRDDYASYPLVTGQQRNGDLVHLITRPNQAAPGLVDIQMKNGQWVGYSTAAGILVAK